VIILLWKYRDIEAMGKTCHSPLRKSMVSMRGLTILAFCAVAALAYLEAARWFQPESRQGEKKEAAQLMQCAMQVVRAEKLKLGIPVDRFADPNGTGMIGTAYNDITTTHGSLVSKRTSTSPAFAAAMVAMLDQAGVRPGDSVAVSFSGSFPALNIAVLSAAKALNLRPVIISSVGASMYGANQPSMTWLDMERVLFERGLFPYRSLVASLGGIVETGGGLDGTGIAEGLAAIKRNKIPYWEESSSGALRADIERRLALFDRALGGRRPAAFINVGGSLTSLGSGLSVRRLPTGLVEKWPVSRDPERGFLLRMAERDVPVIHLLNIRSLAVRYGIPVDPIPLSAAPFGGAMKRGKYSAPLAAAGLALLIGLLPILKAAAARRRRAAG
jgi:poly-gamma-glutamate system protein